MFSSQCLLFSILLFNQARAHVALWDPGMYGFDGTVPGQIDYNNNLPVTPLRRSDNLSQKDWFGHGLLAYPPKTMMSLPAGGVYHAQLGCNRAFTTYRDPNRNDPFIDHACDEVGPLHTVLNFGETLGSNASRYLGGSTLSIAYQSDVRLLQPSDFTVISVVRNSVWWRKVDYEIPAGLPACPPGGCHCAWNWIHTANNYNAQGRSEGEPAEMYMTLYRCTVTGSRFTTAFQRVGPSSPSRLCENNPSECVKGPKQPHYWSQASGNNNFDSVPPTYNSRYGFQEGAQNDIFVQSDKCAIREARRKTKG